MGSTPDPLVGTTVGNYRILSSIGAGGMGNVYLAEHPRIGKRVALKVLLRERASSPTQVQRFLNEARVVASLGHRNIVDIYDFGELRDGRVYFTMELLSGRSVEEAVARHGPFTASFAAWVAAEVCRGLQAAHKRGVIHRDVKAGNVVLCHAEEEGLEVKLLDFGLAKLADDIGNPGITGEGVVVGTPSYMAPEQTRGDTTIDHRVDIYSLGVLMYFMLTGRLPFKAKSLVEMLTKHALESPMPPRRLRPDIPEELEAVILRCMAKSPGARYQSADEVRGELAPLANPEPDSDVVASVSRLDLSETLEALPVAEAAPSSSRPQQPSEPRLADVEPWVPKLAPLGPVDTPRRRAVLVPLLLLALLLVVGGAFAVWLLVSDVGPPPAPMSSTPETAEAIETPLADMVSFSIGTVPPGAAVYVGDEKAPRGTAPLWVMVPAGKPVRITVRHPGYHDLTKLVVGDADQRIVLRLARSE